ncbi:MAG: hypothetical protein OXK80_04410 [Bdellovibrionales bacterium]|nr:hypothetical protein [Bdellovibrionales bacterium]
MFRRRKKHQVRIRHQTQPSSKGKLFFYFILFSLILGGVFILNQNKDIPTNFQTPTKDEDKKDNPLQIQQEEPSLTNKEIQEQIQKDYKSNLLKRRMAEDEAHHKKNKLITEEQPADAKEDYSIKDGVNLSQDESFDKLLDILKEAETETDEDIEDRIARYRIIEEKIQSVQRKPQDNTQDNSVDPRKTFAQEFIVNARKGGYEVQLDNNFKVKSVKKIHTDPYEEALFIDENN